MAVPREARTAYRVESYLRKNMYNTMESEERTSLLEGMCKFGLSTTEVISFMTKQRFAKRFRNHTKTGTLLMRGKLKDSRGIAISWGGRGGSMLNNTDTHSVHTYSCWYFAIQLVQCTPYFLLLYSLYCISNFFWNILECSLRCVLFYLLYPPTALNEGRGKMTKVS